MDRWVPFPGLASLSSLRLAGNPVAYARSYRCDILSCFPPPQQHAIRLDGGVANSHERQRLRRRGSGSGGRMAQVGVTPECRRSMPQPLDSKPADAAQLEAIVKRLRASGVTSSQLLELQLYS